MTSVEFTPADEGIIKGIHTDIILGDATHLQEYLFETHGPETLYRMPSDGLHFPIKFASLEFYKNDADELSLYANSSFNAPIIHGQEIANWQKLLSRRLADTFTSNGFELY